MIDIEDNGVKKNVFQENLNDFIQLIEDKHHQKPIIYTVYSLYDEYLKGDYKDYSIWIRDIVKPPSISEDREWLFWQFSNRGRIKGEKAYYDFNVFMGSIDDLKQ